MNPLFESLVLDIRQHYQEWFYQFTVKPENLSGYNAELYTQDKSQSTYNPLYPERTSCFVAPEHRTIANGLLWLKTYYQRLGSVKQNKHTLYWAPRLQQSKRQLLVNMTRSLLGLMATVPEGKERMQYEKLLDWLQKFKT